MKVLIVCLLLCFLGVTIASPAPSWPNWYNTYSRILNGGIGNTGQQSNEKITQAQSRLGNLITDYVYRAINGGGSKQTSRDEVTAMMESLLKAQHHEEQEDENEDFATLQSLFKVLAKVEEEKAKEMDSSSARAQFLRGLGSTLLNAGRDYLVDRYCPNPEDPTESLINSP